MMKYNKTIALGLIPYILVLFLGFATSDIDQDKQKCANILVGLATCLPYVSGESNVPPVDCCTGFRQVMQKSPECLCLLVKDRNDPSLGLQINATRALSLPTKCKATTTSLSDCPALLHLPPNSPDAKVFDDFANSANNTSTHATANAPAPSAAVRGYRPVVIGSGADTASDGGKIRNRCLGMDIISGLLLIMIVVHKF